MKAAILLVGGSGAPEDSVPLRGPVLPREPMPVPVPDAPPGDAVQPIPAAAPGIPDAPVIAAAAAIPVPPPVPFPPRPLPPSRWRAEREAPPADPPAERSPLRLILILLAGLVCLAGLGWGTATVFGIGPVRPSKGISQAAAGHIYVKLPAMEFAMPDGLRFRQLRVRLVLEMPGDVDRDLIASYVPRIANTVSSRMADVAAEDLNGAEGVGVVKSVVAHAANHELRPLRVRKVLVQEMLLR